MKDIIKILFCIIGGILVGFLFYYVYSAFEVESHLITGISALVFFIIAISSIVIYITVNKGKDKDRQQDKTKFIKFTIGILCFCVFSFVTVLTCWSKEKHDFQKQRSENTTLIEIEKKGWDLICISRAYFYDSSSQKLNESCYYYIFYKNGQYFAVPDYAMIYGKKNNTRRRVTFGDFFHNGTHFNARISDNGLTFHYLNI